jgi:FlaA1/EpsC-like NDP-sugar epimerase
MKDIKEKCIKNITINASEISKERLSDILEECTSGNIKIGNISELKEKLLSGNTNGGDSPDENKSS